MSKTATATAAVGLLAGWSDRRAEAARERWSMIAKRDVHSEKVSQLATGSIDTGPGQVVRSYTIIKGILTMLCEVIEEELDGDIVDIVEQKSMKLLMITVQFE